MISQAGLYQLEELGKRLRYARIRRNWPQTKLSKTTGVSVHTISKMEKGSPTVAIGAYMQVMCMFRISTEIDALALPANDLVGQALDTTPIRQRAGKERKLNCSLVFDI